MKRLALVAAVLVIAACTTKEGATPAKDTVVVTDTLTDTVKLDSIAKDTTKKP